MRKVVIQLVLLLAASAAFAHGGGTDKNGCHTNSKTGDYHCHGGGIAPAVPAAPRSPVVAPVRSRQTSTETDLTPPTAALPASLIGYVYHERACQSVNPATMVRS